mmetsp:Transcript_5821/g.13542  ORF Transcript_5821/g.13542 Transcript_5821/m.13542 type:complete len:312 (-) Transcript_5821:119-1054(-)
MDIRKQRSHRRRASAAVGSLRNEEPKQRRIHAHSQVQCVRVATGVKPRGAQLLDRILADCRRGQPQFVEREARLLRELGSKREHRLVADEPVPVQAEAAQRGCPRQRARQSDGTLVANLVVREVELVDHTIAQCCGELHCSLVTQMVLVQRERRDARRDQPHQLWRVRIHDLFPPKVELVEAGQRRRLHVVEPAETLHRVDGWEWPVLWAGQLFFCRLFAEEFCDTVCRDRLLFALTRQQTADERIAADARACTFHQHEYQRDVCARWGCPRTADAPLALLSATCAWQQSMPVSGHPVSCLKHRQAIEVVR